jgi:hypothetical protein
MNHSTVRTLQCVGLLSWITSALADEPLPIDNIEGRIYSRCPTAMSESGKTPKRLTRPTGEASSLTHPHQSLIINH